MQEKQRKQLEVKDKQRHQEMFSKVSVPTAAKEKRNTQSTRWHTIFIVFKDIDVTVVSCNCGIGLSISHQEHANLKHYRKHSAFNTLERKNSEWPPY